MKKYPSSGSPFLTKLHRFAVNTLVGLTLFGCGILSLQIYSFMTEVRPELEQQKIAEELDQQKQ